MLSLFFPWGVILQALALVPISTRRKGTVTRTIENGEPVSATSDLS